MKIYSLGTSTRTIEEFMGILRQYAIEAAADVRSFPRSGAVFPISMVRNSPVSSERTGSSTAIWEKIWGGTAGGGMRPIYVATPPYNEGLTRLEELARGRTTAFFCAERFPWLCHRRFIGASLRGRGWEVSHIIEAGKVWHPKVRSMGTARGEG